MTGIRILDVGCWDGAFLASCPSSWVRHGVEPNKQAAVLARERGLDVFSETFEMAQLMNESYNVVVMLDVLEHLPHPLSALRKVSEILTSDGYLFGLTGSSNSRGARIFRGCWYYYNYPEHVTFFSPFSVKVAIESLGMKVKAVKKYRPHGSSLVQTGKKIKNLLLNTQEKKAPHLPVPVRKQDMIKLGISRLFRGRNHMIIVAQKGK
ncbi:MAG: class I SAM-dependent methyltransferase [Nitrospirales bacterium]|nr:class I SAM-dependent methyltransferase [Nitrospirales bacterium]